MSKFIEIGGNYYPIDTIVRIEPRVNEDFVSTGFCKGYYKKRNPSCVVYFSTKQNPNQNYYDYQYDSRTAEEMTKVVNEAIFGRKNKEL